MFYGRGAGKLPTASAVVADVIDAAKHLGKRKYLGWGPGGAGAAVPPEDVASQWYLRLERDGEAVCAAFPKAERLSYSGAPAEELAFLTGEVLTRSALEDRLSGHSPAAAFRVLD